MPRSGTAPASPNGVAARSEPLPCVLVVDDDRDLLQLVVDVLTEAGYRVETAHNGQEALERVQSVRPRVVLTDILMPVMGGWEFLRRCRQTAVGADLTVLVMSDLPGLEASASGLNVHSCVPKPFDVEDVLRAVASALRAA